MKNQLITLVVGLFFAMCFAKVGTVNFIFEDMFMETEQKCCNNSSNCSQCCNSTACDNIEEFLHFNTTLGPIDVCSGFGQAFLTVSPLEGVVSWNVTWTLQSAPTFVYFAGPASSGQNAPVQINVGAISGLTSPSIGKANVTQLQIIQITSGLWYVIMNSRDCLNGALRGQFESIYAERTPLPVPAAPVEDKVDLTCSNAISCGSCSAGASGTAVLRLSLETNFLYWDISVCNTPALQLVQLRGPSNPPQVGALQVDFGAESGLISPLKGSIELSTSQRNQYLAGQYYIQVQAGSCFLRGFIRNSFDITTTTTSQVTPSPPTTTTVMTTTRTFAPSSTSTSTATTTTATATTTTTTTTTPTPTSTTPSTTSPSIVARCASSCSSTIPVTNPSPLILRTQNLDPYNPTTWQGANIGLAPAPVCQTPGLQTCRVFVDVNPNYTSSATTLPVSNTEWRIMGATFQGINNVDSCAMSTNDPNGFFFFNTTSQVGPSNALYRVPVRSNWANDQSSGDALCSTYVTVGQGAENDGTPCVHSPTSMFWLNDSVVTNATYFCSPPSAESFILPVLIAQFTVRTGFSVRGTIQVEASNFGFQVSSVLKFNCFSLCP